jgi:ABC-type nitrate/sulfonate/bicarbonate transport system permease component
MTRLLNLEGRMAERRSSATLTAGQADHSLLGVVDVDAPSPLRRRPEGRRSRSSKRAWLLPFGTVAGLLMLVEVVTRLQLLGPHFPTVTETGQELVRQIQSPQFWSRVSETLIGWAGGFVIALIIAVPLGLLIAANRFSFRSSRLIIDFLRPIPPVAVLPLAVLLVGTGTEMKIYLVAFSALWPVLFQTMYGAQDVDPVTRDSARAYGLSNWQQYRHVVLPSAMPYIATGVRLAATIALVVAIATELIVGSVGLGYEINQVRYAANTPAMYALIFVAGLLGWLITVVFTALERRALFWHHSHRETNS